ncbi:DNA-binding protein [Hymenobacter jeollabukensis]|uniref:DNA-binding protein n=1 Tax=Hymenobacter jeollabukensis TaxID=2025313 RepID=A0A5R8WVM0_9BACT|nr:DNA-binding protein [Hymenobacter jeollabukensis]
MTICRVKQLLAAAVLVASTGYAAQAQEYVSPAKGKPVQAGKAPGMQVKLLSTNGQTKTYVLVFAKNDEVMSGLTEFARTYNVKSAHYQAIGDALSAKIGVYDYGRKQFKVISITEPCEVTSLTGDIAVLNGQPAPHSHLNLAAADGSVRGGHLLELVIGPTLELIVTVEPTPLYKRLNEEFDANVIDPALKK